MEGSEAYDMVKDLEVELYEVIEDDILHTDDIDRNYSIFIDEDIVESNYQELGYLNILKNHDHPHPLEFFSRMFSIVQSDHIHTWFYVLNIKLRPPASLY